MYYLVTNNPLVEEKYGNYSNNLEVVSVETKDCRQVLTTARDMIHQGKRLETHPMAGSVKPNQNPYKTIMLSNNQNTEEESKDQLLIIENSIIKATELLNNRKLPEWEEKILKDFQFVDLSLIESGIMHVI